MYNLPREVIVNELIQLLNSALKLFREQIFELFVNKFDEATLQQNDFFITEDNLTRHLRNRSNLQNAVNNIYELGASIHEDRIVTRQDGSKLANGLFKPAEKQPPLKNTPVLEKDIALLIKKMQQVLADNKELKELRKDNANLKKHLTTVEISIIFT